MNVVVIGLGSMGRRRIRLMKTLPDAPDIVGVDLSPERRAQTEKELGIPTVADMAAVIAAHRPTAALVCTSPISHGKIVLECLASGINVFTEINLLSDWYDEAMALAAEKGVKLFISSTFLYRREIEYIVSAVKGNAVDYIYHSGQYLPDWHPWESYKNFFVSDKRTNACREILAIEFPWILKAFGDIESIHVMKDKSSSLDLDFADNYMISIRHKNGNKGVFCQDVISRKGLRHLEVYSEKLHLFWEGTPHSLSVYDIEARELKPILLYEDVEHCAGYNVNIIENAYREELINFFRVLKGEESARYTFEADKQVLAFIDEIESKERQ